MSETENFIVCRFLNLLSEISTDNKKVLDVLQNHKKDLREYFRQYSADNQLADHINLMFESDIIESQLFKNQWSVNKLKAIVNTLIN